jgi:hypothetical protein
MAGRFAFGIIAAPAGAISTIGDTVKAVQNGHNIIDAVSRGGISGLPEKGQ